MISDQLKLLTPVSAPTPPPRVEVSQIQEQSSGIYLKVPACDTETFHGVMNNGRPSGTCLQPYT